MVWLHRATLSDRPAPFDLVAARTRIDPKHRQCTEAHVTIDAFRETTTELYGNAEYLVFEGTYAMGYGAANTSEEGKYINVQMA